MVSVSAFGSGTAPFWLSRADSGAKVESSGEQKWIAGAAMEQKAEHLTKKPNAKLMTTYKNKWWNLWIFG